MQSETEENERVDAEGVDAESEDLDVDAEVVDPAQTVVMSEDTFTDPDISMEVNVEKLVAELEGAESDDAHRKAEIRRRLEELAEDGSFEDTYAIDV
jgi:predicted lipid carrier protein YhbT